MYPESLEESAILYTIIPIIYSRVFNFLLFLFLFYFYFFICCCRGKYILILIGLLFFITHFISTVKFPALQRQPVHHSRQRQPWPHSMMPPTQRMPHWQQQSQQERQLQRGGGGGSMSIGSGNSSSGSGLPLSEPAAGAVSGVIRHQEVGTNVVPLPPPPANPSWVQGSAAATTTAGGADGGDEGGVSEAGVGCREKKVEAVVLKEREAEALAMREAMRAVGHGAILYRRKEKHMRT